MVNEQVEKRADMSVNAEAIHRLVMVGYTHDSVVEAVTSGDLSKLQSTGTYPLSLG